MIHLKIFTIITAVFAINSVAVAQNLGYYDMKPGEIYYVSYAWSESQIIKFRGICRIIDIYDAIDGARISAEDEDFYDGCTNNIHGLQNVIGHSMSDIPNIKRHYMIFCNFEPKNN